MLLELVILATLSISSVEAALVEPPVSFSQSSIRADDSKSSVENITKGRTCIGNSRKTISEITPRELKMIDEINWYLVNEPDLIE
jgi:hypothetical protein